VTVPPTAVLHHHVLTGSQPAAPAAATHTLPHAIRVKPADGSLPDAPPSTTNTVKFKWTTARKAHKLARLYDSDGWSPCSGTCDDGVCALAETFAESGCCLAALPAGAGAGLSVAVTTAAAAPSATGAGRGALLEPSTYEADADDADEAGAYVAAATADGTAEPKAATAAAEVAGHHSHTAQYLCWKVKAHGGHYPPKGSE
jgi:hypothetical protein